MAGLTPKQAVFVAAYLGEANRNATAAARVAGYADPGQRGHELVKKREIQEAISEQIAEIRRKGIALHQNRVDELVDRHRLLKQVIAERAADDGLAEVPGGSTGLVVKRLKVVKHTYDADPDDPDSRPSMQRVEVWESEVDTGLLRELREHEKQVAQELGEWVEKGELTGNDGAPLSVVLQRGPEPSRSDAE